MAIPDFQATMLPLLTELCDGRVRLVKDVTAILADHFQLSEEERRVLLPSGEAPLFSNRVAWAKTHLKNAGLIDNPTRGRIRISEAGLAVLAQKPNSINIRFLKQFPSYLRFIGQSSEESTAPVSIQDPIADEGGLTPKELIDKSFSTLRSATAEDLLDRLKQSSPAFFEQVVVQVLQALGYGATGEALVTGKSGDGGVDGVIKEDKLGLDVVCVQAKKWENSVGRPVIQAFVGSMDYVRAKKGVVISTSTFTRDALDYVGRIEGKKVVLIDGVTLAGLMIDYNVGVIVTSRYEIKELSNDYFEEDEG